MGLFGKSDEEKHIETIQQAVIKVNSLVKSLIAMIEKDEYYCKSHISEVSTMLRDIISHSNIIRQHANCMPEQKSATIQVAWPDGASTSHLMMWTIFIQSVINEIVDCLEKWGIH